jgi:hypothetical protein
MKTTAVQFTRNPKFTPTSLTARQLGRIEWLVRAFFERSYRDGDGGKPWGCYLRSGKEAVKDMTSNWFTPAWAIDSDGGRNCAEVPARKTRHDSRISWLSSNADACKYFSSCWNYLMAIAKSKKEVTEPETHGAAYYGQIRNGYN